MNKTILTLTAAIALTTSAVANVKMPALFTDGMVLQQKTSAPVWGFADPGEKITVSTTWDNKTVSTEAASDGTWKVKVATPSFGGPYALIINGKNTVYINNVMIGEVWFASGQSNMEMPMSGFPYGTIMNGPEDIANSTNNDIRIFMASRNMSFKEENELDGEWKTASPKNTPQFGATCYYFAKKLNAELGVPVGIINSSWGGTPVESWIPQEYIKNVPEYSQIVKDIAASSPIIDKRNNWLKQKQSVSMFPRPDLGDADLAKPYFNDSKWHSMNVPGLWESNNEVRAFDGIVWFRKTIKITPAMVGKELVISLGAIDDGDETFFNGELIGHTNNYQADRVYTVPADKVKAGKAVIAIRVTDNQGGGGLYGQPSKLKCYTKGNEKSAISLAGSWKYLPIAELSRGKLYKFDIPTMEFYQRPISPTDLSEMTATTLYNAMVAPFVGYAMAGAIWYQGEANVGHAEEYTRTFPLMVKAWREKWNQGDFPFYYVQIAPYDYGTNGHSEEIREAQRVSLSMKNSGMASTIDIGNNKNIHPANKVEVGNRLALWAFKNIYGKDVVCSGPLFKSQEIKGNAIYLSFDYADGLNAKGGTLKDFEIAGKDGKYYPATAVIEGSKVKVSSNKVAAPASVRYLWSDCVDQATLYNGAGLPASSFQTTKAW
ncbi:MAG: 9-O-acetylesterase [Bacteroidales bacterium]|nr:9-O-acetylesterase [Bacteroidales bacterium]